VLNSIMLILLAFYNQKNEDLFKDPNANTDNLNLTCGQIFSEIVRD